MTGVLGYPVEPTWRLLLKDLGVDARTVLRRADLPDDLLSQVGTVVKTADYFRLWEALETEVGDPQFPIRLSALIQTEHFSPSLFAALCSPNLTVASRRIARYKRLMSPQRMLVEEGRSGLTVVKEWLEPQLVPPGSLVVMELVFLVQLARTATREPIQPLRIQTLAPPEAQGAYEEFFGVPVERGRRHLIRFSARDAARAFLTANEEMWSFFEPELRRRLAQLEESASASERVRAALLEALPSGRSTIGEIARQLAMSERTLQRRLQADGTSFHFVLQHTREELARHYLTRTRITPAEISFLLGFDEPNSFLRAFRSWTGETPGSIRAAAMS